MSTEIGLSIVLATGPNLNSLHTGLSDVPLKIFQVSEN